MNKKLLMVAVGAALAAAPMVVVHAETTVYGHLHESFDNIDNGTSKNGFVASDSSRFGIKGSEDLGSGLKAIYQMESGAFAMDTGTSGLGGTLRNTYLGFAGSWGAVKVGRYDTPFKDLGRALDNFNEEVGDMRNMLSGGSFSATIPGTTTANPLYNYIDPRVSNMIRYESPSLGGLTVNALHTSSNGTEGPGGTGNSVNSLGVNWSGGPIFVGGAYQKDGFQKGGLITKEHDNLWRLAGGYKMDDLMVGLLYQDLKDVAGNDLSQKAKGIAASYKMANNMIKFHYLTADDYKGAAASCSAVSGSSPATCSGTGGKLWALGVDHMFSKSTLVYVNYAQAKNDSNTRAYSVISGNAGHGEDELPATGKFGQKVRGISAGMVLNF